MQGLELARRYYAAHREALLAPFAAYRARIAAGLVGHGSECLGFDDELSRDHDFGPGFCLWLLQEDYAAIGARLQAAYAALPREFGGLPARREMPRAGQRVGVFAIDGFFAAFLGAPALPISDADWLQIPEEYLAAVCSGEVFEDALGQFTRLRASLQAYYPPTVQRRKLAQAVAKMAQSGQYNLPRALARGEMTSALLAQAGFIQHACRAALALNRRFAPIEKWLHRSLRDLPRQGALYSRIDELARCRPQEAAPRVEAICAILLDELVAQGFTRAGDSFLEHHVDAILGRHATEQT